MSANNKDVEQLMKDVVRLEHQVARYKNIIDDLMSKRVDTLKTHDLTIDKYIDLITDEHVSFMYRVLRAIDKCDSHDSLTWNTHGQYAPVTFFINCSDTFYYASADAEEVTIANIHVLEQSVNDCVKHSIYAGFYAPMLFCARVRNMRPIRRMYPNTTFLEHDMAPVIKMLDEAGPER